MKIHIVIDVPEITNRDDAYDSGIIDTVIEAVDTFIKDKDWWVEIEE